MTEQKKSTKSTLWNMRTDEADKAQISKLAKRLNCKASEAVRRAVVYTLATLPKKSALDMR